MKDNVRKAIGMKKGIRYLTNMIGTRCMMLSFLACLHLIIEPNFIAYRLESCNLGGLFVLFVI